MSKVNYICLRRQKISRTSRQLVNGSSDLLGFSHLTLGVETRRRPGGHTLTYPAVHPTIQFWPSVGHPKTPCRTSIDTLLDTRQRCDGHQSSVRRTPNDTFWTPVDNWLDTWWQPVGHLLTPADTVLDSRRHLSTPSPLGNYWKRQVKNTCEPSSPEEGGRGLATCSGTNKHSVPEPQWAGSEKGKERENVRNQDGAELLT